jgi:hypothetical protein
LIPFILVVIVVLLVGLISSNVVMYQQLIDNVKRLVNKGNPAPEKQFPNRIQIRSFVSKKEKESIVIPKVEKYFLDEEWALYKIEVDVIIRDGYKLVYEYESKEMNRTFSCNYNYPIDPNDDNIKKRKEAVDY